MPIVNWDDTMSVKVAEIDEQHKKLVDMINMLHDAMSQGKSKQVLQDLIQGLIGYTDTHFKTEESYFEKFNYPEKLQHMQEHKAFVDKVTKFKQDYDSGQATMSIEILNFLKDWLVNHIKGTDMKYSTFFNEKGLT